MSFRRHITLLVRLGLLMIVCLEAKRAIGATAQELSEVNQQFSAAYRQGDHKQAALLARKALAMSEEMFGAENQITIQWFDAAGGLSSMAGDYQTALATYERAAKVFAKVFGPESRQVLINLNSLAGAHAALGHTQEAESIYRKMLRLCDSTLGPNDRDMGFVSLRVADFYSSRGRYAEAEPLYQRALKVFQVVVGHNHLDTVGVMNGLAETYRNLGNHAKAEALCRDALEIVRKNPEGERQTATLLACLGAVYLGTGDFTKAEPYLQQALRAAEKLYGPSNREVAAGLNNLAALYSSMGAPAKAEPYAERALQLSENLFGPDRSETLNARQNLAGTYLRAGRPAEAIDLFRKVLDANERLLGPTHPATAAALESLAILHHQRRDLTNAEACYRRAIAIDEKVFGCSHRQTITASGNYCSLLQDLGRREEALTLAAKIGAAQSEEFSNVLSFASERQRLAFRATHDAYNLVASLEAAPEVTLAILRNKCIVLDSILEDRRVAAASTNAEDQALLERISETKQRLSEQFAFNTLPGSHPVSPKESAELRRSLTDQIEQLEGRLARQVAGLGHARRALNVSIAEVQRAIPTNAALVEFVRYWHYVGFQKAEYRYGAALLPSYGKVKWICLGAANTIERNVALYQKLVRDEVEDGDDSLLARTLRQLYQQVWAPLEGALPASTQTILLSPDDQLNFVSFATLLGSDDRFLAQKYSLRYVTSGRDLLRAIKPPASQEMLIFAAPSYSSAASGRESPGFYLAPLPELATNAAVLEAKAKQWEWPTRTYVGADATEQRVHDVQSPRILHLSTHGFFLPEIIDHAEPAPLFNPLGVQSSVSGVALLNPMRRSGVALAGAQDTLNAWQRGRVPAAPSDGILTAEEVCGMRLVGTWLVTLAACDTGFGTSVAGESVMGLRRGFALAGVRNLLMTLWPVAVKETDDFLLDFYSAAHESGNAPESLAKVQREWLVKVRAQRGLSSAVFLGGPFVLSTQGPMP